MLAIVCLLVSCVAQGAEMQSAPASSCLDANFPKLTTADLSRPEWIAEGKKQFVQTCAYCHGQEGEAGKVRPFRTHTNWDPKEIFNTISEGRRRGGNVMPTWKGAIPAEDIWKIVAYIKSLSAPNEAIAAEAQSTPGSSSLADRGECTGIANTRPSDGELASAEWIEQGKTHFVQTCAYCHGQEGEAGKVRPFRTHTDWDPQAIFDTISNGRRKGSNVMPSWKDSIPKEEIWKIVAYIKSLSAGATHNAQH